MGPDVERGQWLRTHGVRPWNQCLKSCFIIIWQLLAPFTSQPRVHKWAGSTTGWVLMWNGDSGADTWCPAMEPMSQIMFYNHLATFGTIYKSSKGPQVGRFHNGMVLMWNGDRCVRSNGPRSTSGPIPLWNLPTCGPLADL